MRLSKIKLAGFKSFVDPTTIHLKSNLVGVVGPNGSGKSNVIDAVRWVMGESSAKHLRGESMSDVIFTGSSARKPVGQASIELVFDNSLGKLGGKWAEYAEISVKRQVTRDGQSNYYLNGARCRRRDITDIFLGTGLGPRSYAIIEQGMISRLIEAKPEELRMLLEEAAGISKYKERRRETETRIRHTNDNLSRLMDLRDELDKQLEKLKRQARTAERYKELKTEEREVEGQLMAMQWRALDDETKNSERLLSQLQTGLEGEIATQRSYEAAIEGQREAHTEASDAYNEVQGRFYQQGADISSKEQAIQHAKERRQNLENDLREVNNTLAQTQAHQGADIARVDELKRQIENLEPRQQDLSEAAEASKTILDDAEAALQTWQQEWDEFSQDANRPNQVAEVERTRIATTEQQSHQLEQRYRRLQEELNSVNTHEFEQAIEHLNEQQAEGQERVDTLVADQETTQQLLNEQRETLKSANHKLNEAQQHLRENQGRTASLKALQEAALGQSQTDTVEWLSRNGLNDHKRLAQSIEVQTGWEKAVETVLGFHLDAVVVDSIADVEHALSQLPQGDIGFIAGMAADISPVANLGDLKALSTIVQSSKAIPSLLNNIFCADNLSQAIAAQSQLSANQSIVTRDGIWLGKNWLRVNQAQTESSGVLDRERQLRQLDQEQTQLQQNVDDLTAIIEDAQNELHELESKRDEIHAQRIEHEQKLSSLKAELSNKQHRLEQVISRRQTIEAECNEISQQISTNTESVQAARVELEKAVEEMDTVSQRREALAYRRDQLRGLFDEHRSKAQNDQQQLQQATLELHTAKNSLETTQRNLSRVDEQLGSLLNRQAELQGNIETALEPITQLQSELESLLNQRVEIDAQLSDTRRKMEAVDEEMRGL
ncbi:MAG: chromosome segregation protein SMC, partial [Gammaproteobacteria bacterium]|nr:chromosome segregation protein SMC [Gammaproteobacteria bacterium]